MIDGWGPHFVNNKMANGSINLLINQTKHNRFVHKEAIPNHFLPTYINMELGNTNPLTSMKKE
jgi:hypothetical protein